MYGSGLFAGMGAHSDAQAKAAKELKERNYRIELSRQMHERKIREHAAKLKERAEAENEEARVKHEMEIL